MQIIEITSSSASVSFTEAELVLLNNALNEVLHGIVIPEFQTRMASSPQETDKVLKQIQALLSKMR